MTSTTLLPFPSQQSLCYAPGAPGRPADQPAIPAASPLPAAALRPVDRQVPRRPMPRRGVQRRRRGWWMESSGNTDTEFIGCRTLSFGQWGRGQKRLVWLVAFDRVSPAAATGYYRGWWGTAHSPSSCSFILSSAALWLGFRRISMVGAGVQGGWCMASAEGEGNLSYFDSRPWRHRFKTFWLAAGARGSGPREGRRYGRDSACHGSLCLKLLCRSLYVLFPLSIHSHLQMYAL